MQWENRSQEEKDIINEKVSVGVCKALKDDPSIITRSKESRKKLLNTLIRCP